MGEVQGLRQRKELAVKSAVALANTKGGVLLFGVEDDGTITGCPKSDPQALMEAIYDIIWGGALRR